MKTIWLKQPSVLVCYAFSVCNSLINCRLATGETDTKKICRIHLSISHLSHKAPAKSDLNSFLLSSSHFSFRLFSPEPLLESRPGLGARGDKKQLPTWNNSTFSTSSLGFSSSLASLCSWGRWNYSGIFICFRKKKLSQEWRPRGESKNNFHIAAQKGFFIRPLAVWRRSGKQF